MHMCVCAPKRGCVPGCQSVHAFLYVCLCIHTCISYGYRASCTHTCQAPWCTCVGTFEC